MARFRSTGQPEKTEVSAEYFLELFTCNRPENSRLNWEKSHPEKTGAFQRLYGKCSVLQTGTHFVPQKPSIFRKIVIFSFFLHQKMSKSTIKHRVLSELENREV